MFGNRAKISAEELAYMKEQLDNDRGFFENVNAKSKLIEADFDELEKSRQLQGDRCAGSVRFFGL